MSLLLRRAQGQTRGNRLLKMEGRPERLSTTPSKGFRGISSRSAPDPWSNMVDRYFDGIDREWTRRVGNRR